MFPGYLLDKHPEKIGEVEEATVCFSFIDDPCYYECQIEIINCGNFYLYNLVTPTEWQSTTRYCSK